MVQGINTFLLVLAAIFPVVNPPGTALVSLALTRGAEPPLRRELAWRVAKQPRTHGRSGAGHLPDRQLVGHHGHRRSRLSVVRLRRPHPTLIGQGATDIALGLSAFILFCLGVQILWSGGSELLRSVLQG